MRIWTVHPKHLDAKGLVALWRETLLARAVLRGETQGYRYHPQLERFRGVSGSISALNAYLRAVYEEAEARGYHFDRGKLGILRKRMPLIETRGQLEFEWEHLLGKLKRRSPELYERWAPRKRIEPHPLFRIVPGPIAEWERIEP